MNHICSCLVYHPTPPPHPTPPHTRPHHTTPHHTTPHHPTPPHTTPPHPTPPPPPTVTSQKAGRRPVRKHHGSEVTQFRTPCFSAALGSRSSNLGFTRPSPRFLASFPRVDRRHGLRQCAGTSLGAHLPAHGQGLGQQRHLGLAKGGGRFWAVKRGSFWAWGSKGREDCLLTLAKLEENHV